MVELNKQDHGGALLSGGVPGNRGGTGRPKSEVRLRCRGSFDQRIPIIEAIIDSGESSSADKLRAMDLLGKYGGLHQIDATSGVKPLMTSEEAARRRGVADVVLGSDGAEPRYVVAASHADHFGLPFRVLSSQ